MGTVVIVVLGLLALVASALIYSGYWASWALLAVPTAAYVALPAFGLTVVLLGTGMAWGEGGGYLLGALGMLVGLAGIVLLLASPRWLGPRWYRQARAAAGSEPIPAHLVPPRAERMRRP